MSISTKIKYSKKIKNLLNRRNNINIENLDKATQELAEIGRNVVYNAYDAIGYDNSNKSFDVIVEKIKNGYAISAFGKSVTFLEFGAGKQRNTSHPLLDTFGFQYGEYGKKLGRRKAWAFYGTLNANSADGYQRGGVVVTKGNDASQGMIKATYAIKENMRNILAKYEVTK